MSNDRRATTVFPFPPEYRASGVLLMVKKALHSRVTTVFPRQGQYAHDRHIKADVDVAALAARLQDEGAKAFVNSWNEIMGVIAAKSATLAKAR